MSDQDLVCGNCGRAGSFTASVSVVLVFAQQLDKPYPLIPEEHYCICGGCDAVITFIDRAVDAHPVTRAAGPWSRAIVVFSDGHGVDVRPKRAPQWIARA